MSEQKTIKVGERKYTLVFPAIAAALVEFGIEFEFKSGRYDFWVESGNYQIYPGSNNRIHLQRMDDGEILPITELFALIA